MKLGANNMKWQYGTKNDASDDVSGGYQILPGTPSTTSPHPAHPPTALPLFINVSLAALLFRASKTAR